MDNDKVQIEMTADELHEYRAWQRKRGKAKQHEAPQEVPQGERVYIWKATGRGIMTSGDGSRAMVIRSRKEAEYVAHQLGLKYGKKMYLEEATVAEYEKYKKEPKY